MSITRTVDELSVVCLAEEEPAGSRAEGPYALMRVAGSMALGLTGVLASIAAPLAAAQISIEAAQPRLDLSILASLPSKTVVLGVLDLNDPTPETPAVIALRIGAALRHVPPSRLVLAPDCGMKYLSRDVALAKLRAMVSAARAIAEPAR